MTITGRLSSLATTARLAGQGKDAQGSDWMGWNVTWRTLEHPMGDADLEAKFRGLAEGALPDARLDALIAACWGVADLKDAGEVSRLAGHA